MRVIQVRKTKPAKKHYGRWIARGLLAVVVFGVIAGVVNYFRPLPPISIVDTRKFTLPARATNLEWPSYGQSSLALADGTLLATSGAQTPLATASIAKVITALCILEKYPLKDGETGPTITLTESDVAIYSEYVALDGSVVPVAAGQEFTQYELLEAVMLPSANNLADTAAIWAYGSIENYLVAANNYLTKNGLANTRVGVDASGLDAATASTATDLAKLGSLALKNPVLMEIAGKESVVLPHVGKVTNYNFVLGEAGIIGIKTGNNDQNTGALLFASNLPTPAGTIQVTGAVMGANNLLQAERDSVKLLNSAMSGFSKTEIAKKGTILGTYRAPWGETREAIASSDLTVTRWNAQPVTGHAVLEDIQNYSTNGTVGTLYARIIHTAGKTPIVLDEPFAGPSFWWRVLRP